MCFFYQVLFFYLKGVKIMTEKLELYKCNLCGNVVEVVKNGAGELVCCAQPMEKIIPQHKEHEKNEYHVPVIIEHEDCNEIQIGEKPHPMTDEHFIEFIEVYTKDNNKIARHYLTANDIPSIKVPKCFDLGRVVAMCNKHGLWSNL